jgi:hypothetical protein
VGTDCASGTCNGGTCATSDTGEACEETADCSSGALCSNGVCGSNCNASTATELGAPGNEVTVPRDGCVKVETGYPDWWATRSMRLETMDIANYVEVYPVPFSYSNTCASNSGNMTFTQNYGNGVVIGNTNKACATVIDLLGSPGGNVKIRYYAN